MSPDEVTPPEGVKAQQGAGTEEIDRLRRENEELRSERSRAGGRPAEERGAGRSFVAWLLIVLTCLGTLLAVLATWTHWTVLNTDRFVDTVAPLVREDAVAEAISKEAVSRLFSQYDVKNRIEDELEKGLPDALGFAAEPAAEGAESLAEFLATQIIKSNQFQTVWRGILRVAHSQALAGIREGGALEVTPRGAVTLNISELVEDLRDRMVQLGLGFLEDIDIPEDLGSVVLYRNAQLGNVKAAVNTLDALFWILPWVAALLMIGAVAVANNRRSALIAVCVGVIIAMILALVALAIVKPHYLSQIEDDTNRHAAIVAASSVQRGLNTVTAGMMVVSVLAIIAAIVSGPAAWSKKLHNAISIPRHMNRKRAEASGAEADRISPVTKYAWLFRVGGLAVAVLLLLYLPQMTAGVVVAIGILFALYLVAVEITS